MILEIKQMLLGKNWFVVWGDKWKNESLMQIKAMIDYSP